MPVEIWKKNLYVVVVVELGVLMAFTFAMPFIPLYIKDVGGFSTSEAAFWSGIAIGGSGFGMFITAPFWGMAADRWGRKSMLIRAQIGGAVLYGLLAVAPDVTSIVILRVLQGVFTGTVSAASALVASQTPGNKLNYAMGLMMAALFCGTASGPFIGGMLADSIGYTATFLVTAGILLLGGLAILFLVHEKFESSTTKQGIQLKSLLSLARSRKMLPLLLMMAAIFAGPQMISPIIVLSVREMSPPEITATLSGQALGLVGLLSVVSSVTSGKLGTRFSLPRIMFVCCLVTGLMYLLPLCAANVTQFIIFVGLTGLFIGGLHTSTNTMIGLAAPRAQQGIAYGLAGSANSLGIGFGSLIGGTLAQIIGLRPVFAVAAGLFLVISAMIIKFIPPPAKVGSHPIELNK